MRLIRRLPKRGFTNISRRVLTPVNLAQLETFENGAEVTPDILKARGMAKGVKDGIKILGDGALTKKLTVKAHAFSASAKTKIEAVGGACVIVA